VTTCGFCRYLIGWSFGVSEVAAVLTVMDTVAALGDVKRNRCDQNDVQPMMIDRITDTVMRMPTEFHQLIARQRNQVPTVEDLLVSEI